MNHGAKTIDRSTNRRSFLKGAACAAAACGVPAIVPSSVFGALAPSGRINVAMIGMGNQSTLDLPAFLDQDDVQLVAVCDVNTASHGYRTPDQFLGRKPGQDSVNAYYAKKTGANQYKGCDAYNDFREVIGRKDVDAVALVVPDHWHAIMTVAAAKAGKDIYCEKPLSLTVRDGQAMVKAVREHKRVLQTGSMWRSNPVVRRVCELVRNGRVGKIQRIITEVSENNFKGPGPGWKPTPVPEGFDYDLWLGPAPLAPYHKDRCFYKFRFIMDYSGGQTTNFGAHSHGVVQWALGTDNTGPVEFEDLNSKWPLPGDLFTTPDVVHFRCRYANGIEMECKTTERGFGARFEGTEGWVEFAGNGIQASSSALKDSVIGPQEIHLPLAVKDRPKDAPARSMSFDHVRNFLDCIKSREDPVEFVEAGHRTASICHLGNIAMKLRRKIQWDPEHEQIIGDDEAAKMLGRPLRAPWTL
jgi:predicted dehydrogenase